MTVRVVYDNQIFSSQVYGGISRYFVNLAIELAKLPDIEPLIVAPRHLTAYLDEIPKEYVVGKKMAPLPKLNIINRWLSSVETGIKMKRLDADIVHKTYYYPIPSAPKSSRTVITVYDMIHEKFPDNFRKNDPIRKWKKSALNKSDHIICISEKTRNDLLSMYPIPENKVTVTYLGYDPLDKILPREDSLTFRKRILGTDAPYLLFVGSRGGYKNFTGLLQAYSESRHLRNNYFLLCFGGGEFSNNEKSLISQYGLLETVKQIGGSDKILASCYKHTSLFVYPSIYEGFGIPPLEAMSLDCPVACSNSSSIPEVVGNAAASFDPSKPDSIREVIERVITSDQERNDLIELGKIRRSLFSWRKCSEDTLNVYRNVIGI